MRSDELLPERLLLIAVELGRVVVEVELGRVAEAVELGRLAEVVELGRLTEVVVPVLPEVPGVGRTVVLVGLELLPL